MTATDPPECPEGFGIGRLPGRGLTKGLKYGRLMHHQTRPVRRIPRRPEKGLPVSKNVLFALITALFTSACGVSPAGSSGGGSGSGTDGGSGQGSSCVTDVAAQVWGGPGRPEEFAKIHGDVALGNDLEIRVGDFVLRLYSKTADFPTSLTSMPASVDVTVDFSKQNDTMTCGGCLVMYDGDPADPGAWRYFAQSGKLHITKLAKGPSGFKAVMTDVLLKHVMFTSGAMSAAPDGCTARIPSVTIDAVVNYLTDQITPRTF